MLSRILGGTLFAFGMLISQTFLFMHPGNGRLLIAITGSLVGGSLLAIGYGRLMLAGRRGSIGSYLLVLAAIGVVLFPRLGWLFTANFLTTFLVFFGMLPQAESCDDGD